MPAMKTAERFFGKEVFVTLVYADRVIVKRGAKSETFAAADRGKRPLYGISD
jgi:hypothetical protein